MVTKIRKNTKKKSAKIKKDKIDKISKDVADAANAECAMPASTSVDPNMLVPTGSTTFNLECSGKKEGAFLVGKMVNLIGDSHAGKTLFALTIFAECSLLPRFDDYDFIYDDVEAANEFDIPYLFGDKVEGRIECGIRSRTIEDLNDNLARKLAGDRPFIYVLDSFDALTSEAAMEKDSENRKKREKGNKITGSYGDGKAKKSSEMFSQRIQELADQGSVLIIISQTRDNIGFGAQFTPKVRSGGKALKFYAFHEIWLACKKREKKGKRTFNTWVQAKITKNKLIGRHGETEFPILFDYGIDDIASCIKFMVEEGPWTASAKTMGAATSINTKGFTDNMTFSKLIRHIEAEDMEDDLCQACQDAYDSVMNDLMPKRKRKY